MSLVQLLVVGKSICNVEDHQSPYRMLRQHLLPKFGGDEDGEVGQARAVMPNDGAIGAVGERVGNISATIQLGEARSQATEVAAPAAPVVPVVPVVPAAEVRETSAVRPRERWMWGRNPFAYKGKPKKGPDAVQGELSLDAIKVIRNDLNDADLEIVPARAAPAPAPAPPRPHPGVIRAAMDLFLRRITPRFFGMGPERRQNLKR